jgi:hypothetical protein
MTLRNLMALSTAAALAAACDSGDINIQPTTVSNVTNPGNGGGGGGNGNGPDPANPCAYYVDDANVAAQGAFDGTHCTYSRDFVDSSNRLMFDMTIPALANGGAHIFEGSLFVGENYTTNDAMQNAGIAQGGDGPTLTVEAGAVLAWQSNSEFMVINRGSQIIAQGRADAPIVFTSVSDVNGTVAFDAVQEWGGMVINGFGITNQCRYIGSVAGGDLALDGECHVASEGSAGIDENHYGGDNNDDNSGVLDFAIVKHTGAEVENGDELNGITFSGVGRGTVVKNLQVYSTYDDGIEMFGGAFDVENFVALYVRDDSIDVDEGYQGTISYALIIQPESDGNQCIEADGIGDYSNRDDTAAVIAQGINTRVTINKLTCIFSPNVVPPGTHDPGAGPRVREGMFLTLNDALIVGSFAANDTSSTTDNFCLRVDDPETRQGGLDGEWGFSSVIFACAERVQSTAPWPDGITTAEGFMTDAGNIFATIPDGIAVNPTPTNDPELQLLEGTPPIYSIGYATMQVDGAAPAGAPQDGTFIGALSLGETDWTQPWAYGLHDGNRAAPLWFE